MRRQQTKAGQHDFGLLPGITSLDLIGLYGVFFHEIKNLKKFEKNVDKTQLMAYNE